MIIKYLIWTTSISLGLWLIMPALTCDEAAVYKALTIKQKVLDDGKRWTDREEKRLQVLLANCACDN